MAGRNALESVELSLNMEHAGLADDFPDEFDEDSTKMIRSLSVHVSAIARTGPRTAYDVEAYFGGKCKFRTRDPCRVSGRAFYPAQRFRRQAAGR